VRCAREVEEEVRVFTTEDDWDFEDICAVLAMNLIEAPQVDVGEWQAQKIDNPLWITREMQNVVIELGVAPTIEEFQRFVQPNLPWAEDHFLERVSGVALNPPPSEAWWPHAQQGNAEHKKNEKFSHTYPERFWPKYAGDAPRPEPSTMHGVRYAYGDLDDVVDQLGNSPLTRQAYLPVWFPEDTGAVHKERVPCSLGYHFLLRSDRLHITYFIRSCDLVRHFRDDVYMAGRLCQWVARQLVERHEVRATPGLLTMHMVSLHIFSGDVPSLKRKWLP
jgi:hypothetical protein